jgi:hypothetical protein
MNAILLILAVLAGSITRFTRIHRPQATGRPAPSSGESTAKQTRHRSARKRIHAKNSHSLIRVNQKSFRWDGDVLADDRVLEGVHQVS